MTLRRRLLIGIIGLLAAVSTVVGTVSVLTLQSSLIARLDSQLVAATSRTALVVDGGGAGPQAPGGNGGNGGNDGDGDRPRPENYLRQSGLPPKTIGGILTGTDLDIRILGKDLEVTEIAPQQVSLILALPADGTPRTVDLGGNLGDYRVSIAESEGVRAESIMVGFPLDDVDATVRQLGIVVGSVTLAALLAAFFVGRSFVGVALRPLTRVAAAATQVSELPLDRGEVALAVRVSDEDSNPSTEVGQVGAAVNRMLGHVASALTAREASESKVRTFVADASHELRTPLASIRGYAELTRRGGHSLPPDVVHALSRVESEAVRMTGLVEDLLLLARLDEGRSLESTSVDLTALLADAVSDANAAGQEHQWHLDLPVDPVVVSGDPVRLHQVIANILTNARVHTPAGTRVDATLSTTPDAAVVTVTDAGPGIDAAVVDSVFERFARADTSRSRAAGSTGLGLAIVAAIVHAHGGTVTVSTEPGRTSFTVTLPRSSVKKLPRS